MVSSEENIQTQQKDFSQNLEVKSNTDSASEKSNHKYSESDSHGDSFHKDENDQNQQREEIIQNHFKIAYDGKAAVLELFDQSEPPEPPQELNKETKTAPLNSPPPPPVADFETAIAATGYGKFNYLLLLIALPCCLTSQFDTTTSSYIIAAAECDLDLKLSDKGDLNAVTYAGMISSAFMWGFLADTLGRKKLLVFGYLIDGLCNIGVTLSYTKTMMMVFKYISGFVICGPFAILMTYLSELHGLQHRGRVMLAVGICFSVGNIVLPLLGLLILPSKMELILIEDVLKLSTWQLYLAACTIPPFISFLLVSFLPESPKFLMSRGKNTQAMKVFQSLYSINTGHKPDEFPIKQLVDETASTSDKPKDVEECSNGTEHDIDILTKSTTDLHHHHSKFRDGLSQFSVMFQKPHLHNSLLVYSIQFSILFGLNSLRLWVPQLFNIIFEYHNDFPLGNTEADLCTMIEHKVNKSLMLPFGPNILSTTTALPDMLDPIIDSSFVAMEDIGLPLERTCDVVIDAEVYSNAIVLGFIQMGGYLISGSIINFVGNKRLLIVGLIMSGSCGIGLYFAKDTLATLILSSLYVTISSICSTALVSATVVLFPTSLRTMIVSLLMMFGRIGALIGNMLFPLLMGCGCLPPFLMVGGTTIACSLICFFLPKTIKKPLR